MARRTQLGLAALTLVVVAIMAFDIQDRWRSPTRSPASARSTHGAPPAPDVQRGLDKTPLVYPAQFVDQLVQRTRPAFVTARATDTAEEAAGVVIAPGQALLASASGAATWRLTSADGGRLDATLIATDPVSGVSLVAVPEGERSVLPFGPPALTSGSPVVAVRPADTTLVTQLIPAPGTEASLAARLAGSALAAGTAVIDLDGRLVAFFGAGVSGGVPMIVEELEHRVLPALREGRAPDVAWTGADLQPLGGALTQTFGEGIAVVTHVEPGSPAAAAGLAARDVLTSVHADGQPVHDVETLAATTRPGTRLVLDVRRGRTQRPITFTVGRRTYPVGVESATGVAVDGDVPVVRVAPASPLARAGLRTGDAVEAVDGRAVTADTLARVLRQQRPVVLTVRRDGRRRFVALPGGEASRSERT